MRMTDLSESRLAGLLGYLGAASFGVGALVALVGGTAALAVGRLGGALGLWSESVLLLLLGGLAALFSWLARHDWKARTGATGAMLVLVALIGAVLLGFDGSLFGLVGVVLALVAGVLGLVAPVQRALAALPAA